MTNELLVPKICFKKEKLHNQTSKHNRSRYKFSKKRDTVASVITHKEGRGLIAFSYLFCAVTKIAEYETNTFHAFTKLVLKFYFVYKCIF